MFKVVFLILLEVTTMLIPCICYSMVRKANRNTTKSEDDEFGRCKVYQFFGASSCQNNITKDIEYAIKSVCPVQNKSEEMVGVQLNALYEKIDALQNRSEMKYGEQLNRLSTHISVLQNRHKETIDQQFNILAAKSDQKFEKMEALENGTNYKLEQLEALVKTMENKLDKISQDVTKIMKASFPGIGSCPLGYLYFKANNFCYKFHKMCKPWSEAREACRREGGDLISLKESNFEFFQEVARTNMGGCSRPYVWVGATDAASEGNWFWLNGEKTTSVFWYPGQPDNKGGVEHCGNLIQYWKYKMNDEPCSQETNFICQIYL